MPGDGASPPGFIVIEGPIGVGKTSLVHRLSYSFACEALLERVEENPFLERFYSDRAAAAFPAQLHFLFQRSRQLDQLRQRGLFSETLVADFLFAKDRLFAQLNLQLDELALYDEVYRRLSMDAPTPDLVVYLQAPAETLLTRVRRRARPQEQALSLGYLQEVAEAYAEFFYRFDEAPVLIVNAESFNPIDHEPDYRALLSRIREPHAGRSYFNPSPLAIHSK
jgi:deoxyadenosine/deoxycytidine kinase